MRIDMEGRVVVRKYAVKTRMAGMYLTAFEKPTLRGKTQWSSNLDDALLFENVIDAPADTVTKVVPVLVLDSQEGKSS